MRTSSDVERHGPDRVVTFRTERGDFVVPGELFGEGREHDLAVYLARRLPIACTSVSRRAQPDGSALVVWRKVRIVPLPAGGYDRR